MCDYSLHHVATRPAKLQDKLVTTKFGNSITHGFAAVGEPHVAVCLLPGTELAFDENVKCRLLFDISFLSSKKVGQRLARFRQINAESAVTHHVRWNFQTAKSYCLHVCARVNAQRYCSCRLPHTCSRVRSRGERFVGVPS
jgi:hypothetical protein